MRRIANSDFFKGSTASLSINQRLLLRRTDVQRIKMSLMWPDIPEFEQRRFNEVFDQIVPECTREYLLDVYRLGHIDGWQICAAAHELEGSQNMDEGLKRALSSRWREEKQ